ncbi:hypothetical protein [Parasphingopyxis lamellibrachiae]|uniref:Uncharacterized protein n=1 Tax=Parasphingopyxis lamellibrachiae TaxID=680125 RepID=A0A3D9FES9_9SPHN|nr:hypothetical protein [Parasphingopyxis lamellibrachiae]RED16243.1 hypothetical protein DFR46_1262 [Parasphingopyxis lamellibrachiae]
MTVQNQIVAQESAGSELEQVSRLYTVLSIVEQMVPQDAKSRDIPDEATLRRAFGRTPGIARNGFQSVADQTVLAATAGARALLGKGPEASIAAEELARHLRQRIFQLGRFVGL